MIADMGSKLVAPVMRPTRRMNELNWRAVATSARRPASRAPEKRLASHACSTRSPPKRTRVSAEMAKCMSAAPAAAADTVKMGSAGASPSAGASTRSVPSGACSPERRTATQSGRGS
jgi:hypothetical protein